MQDYASMNIQSIELAIQLRTVKVQVQVQVQESSSSSSLCLCSHPAPCWCFHQQELDNSIPIIRKFHNDPVIE